MFLKISRFHAKEGGLLLQENVEEQLLTGFHNCKKIADAAYFVKE